MGKQNLTIGIDSNIAELIKSKYKGQISKLVEEYFRGLINLSYDFEGQSKEQIITEKEKVEQEIQKLRAKRDSLQAEEKKKEKQEKKDLDDYIKKGGAMIRSFKASGMD